MYGMTTAQEASLKSLCTTLGGASFVAGQACDVLAGKTDAVISLLEDLCVLGALECPQTEGLEVPRFRVSRQCLSMLTS